MTKNLTNLNILNNSIKNIRNVDDIQIIASLATIESKSMNVKQDKPQLVASIKLSLEKISIKDLIGNMSKLVLDLSEIHIIYVDFNILVNKIGSTIEIREKVGNDAGNNPFKIILHIMNYNTFFKNLDNNLKTFISNDEQENKDYLGLNPIVVFNGIAWSNIVYLFELHGLTVHGGSISRRHKLSMTQFKLAKFMDLSGFFTSKQNYYVSYVENFFTKAKYDEDFYKHIFNNNNALNFKHLNPVILEYFKINRIIYLRTSILDLSKQAEKCLLEKQSFDMSLDWNNNELKDIDRKIFLKRKSLVEGISTKHKASLTGIIKKSSNRKMELIQENGLINKNLSPLNLNFSNINLKLNNYKKELEALEMEKVDLSNSNNSNSSNNPTNSNNSNYSNNPNNSNNSNYSKLSNPLSPFTLSSLPINSRVSIGNNYNYLNNNKQIHTHSLRISRSHTIKKNHFDINSPFFIELNRILSNSPLDHNTQTRIEQFLFKQGAALMDSKLTESLDLNYNLLNPEIIKELKASIQVLFLLLNNFKDDLTRVSNINNKKKYGTYYKLLFETLTIEDIIGILLGRLLRIISNNTVINKNNIHTDVAIDLANDLIGTYLKKEFYKYLSEIKKGGENYLSEYSLSSFLKEDSMKRVRYIEETTLFNIGIIFLSFLEEAKMIEVVIIVLGKEEKRSVIRVMKSISDKIGQYKLLNLPYKLPMIVTPNKYNRDIKTGKEKLGGFLLNDKEFISPLIINNWELKDQSVINNSNKIYEMVNNLSSVGFKINQQVLDFILEYGLKFELVIDPNYIHPLAIKNPNKLSKDERKNLESFISKQNLEMNILGLAQIYQNVPEFFIPIRIDNRGRVYCMVDYLNYQSIELAKALLLFSKEEKVFKADNRSIDYLKVFGANCFGNKIDKKSFKERVEWVDSNEEEILNMLNGKLIRQAEAKLLFVAFCFEFIKYKESLNNNNTFYYTNLPIQLDATCNGYQHLALLTGDHSLAKELNLEPSSWDDKPKDFYTFVALKLKEYFQDKIKEIKNKENSKEVEDLVNYERLSNLNIHRSLVKTPIMVKPYNASLFQMSNYIKDQFNLLKNNNNRNEYVKLPNVQNVLKKVEYKKGIVNLNKKRKNKNLSIIDPDSMDLGLAKPIWSRVNWYEYKKDLNIKLNDKDFTLLASAINLILYKEFPKLKDFNFYLKKIAEICVKLDITIPWYLPSGLNVNQYYLKSDAIRLKPFTFRKQTFSLNIPNKHKINKPKQIRALMPNLVHSLDAVSLALLTDLYFNEKKENIKSINFYSVHDCFAVTANNVDVLVNKIKLVYLMIYSDDEYLINFDKGIKEHIKLQFGKESFNDKKNEIKVNDLELTYPNIEEVINGKHSSINKLQGSAYLIT